MAEEFQNAEKGKTMVTVGISGTGGGFKKFCRGETDISNASRPIKDSERKLCEENGVEFIELPAALDALTVVINPKNDWVKHLNVEDLKKAWEPAAQGKVMTWKQMNPAFPDRPLKLLVQAPTQALTIISLKRLLKTSLAVAISPPAKTITLLFKVYLTTLML